MRKTFILEVRKMRLSREHYLESPSKFDSDAYETRPLLPRPIVLYTWQLDPCALLMFTDRDGGI